MIVLRRINYILVLEMDHGFYSSSVLAGIIA